MRVMLDGFGSDRMQDFSGADGRPELEALELVRPALAGWKLATDHHQLLATRRRKGTVEHLCLEYEAGSWGLTAQVLQGRRISAYSDALTVGGGIVLGGAVAVTAWYFGSPWPLSLAPLPAVWVIGVALASAQTKDEAASVAVCQQVFDRICRLEGVTASEG